MKTRSLEEVCGPFRNLEEVCYLEQSWELGGGKRRDGEWPVRSLRAMMMLCTHVHTQIEGRRWHLGDTTWALVEPLAGSKIGVQETTGGCFCVSFEN